jgi:hypothetical protein
MRPQPLLVVTRHPRWPTRPPELTTSFTRYRMRESGVRRRSQTRGVAPGSCRLGLASHMTQRRLDVDARACQISRPVGRPIRSPTWSCRVRDHSDRRVRWLQLTASGADVFTTVRKECSLGPRGLSACASDGVRHAQPLNVLTGHSCINIADRSGKERGEGELDSRDS